MDLDQLEERLADPAFGPDRLLALDQREEFPTQACQVLDEVGLQRYYVPTRHGGRLSDFSASLPLLRAVARRDLTVMIAHGKTFLGAVSVWVGGDAEQAARLGEQITGGAVVSWGLTERDHGSDLFAGEVSAEPAVDGWLLTGEKWLINNATRGDLICVLARTRAAGGPRGFSSFLVDKRQLDPARFRCLPKVPTHGIRGAEISGISFDRAWVPATALVGAAGEGLAITLRALQLTRTGCAALSLGAADHGLSLAVRHLTGAAEPIGVTQRRVLGEAVAAVAVAEAVGVVATRSIHALPAELTAVSAITKAFVPTVVEQLLDRLGELLGPVAGQPGGEFDKLRRDHPIVGIFDGSTLVNRNALINQFPKLAGAYRALPGDRAGVRAVTTLGVSLPEFDPQRLSLLSRSACSLIQELPEAVGRLPAGSVLTRLATALLTATDDLHHELTTVQSSVRDVPPEAFALAERFELCFAGAAVVGLWLGNTTESVRCWPGLLGWAAAWPDALWARAALGWLLTELGVEVDAGQRDDAYLQLGTDLLAGGWWPVGPEAPATSPKERR